MELIELAGHLLIGILEIIFTPIYEHTFGKAKNNLQRVRDELSVKGANNIQTKYLQYQRWGKRTYSLSFENSDGVACKTEFMIPKHDIYAIEWTTPPKEML